METKFLIGNPVLNNEVTGTTLYKTAKELGLRCDTTVHQCQLDYPAVPIYVSPDNTVINLFEFAYLKSLGKYHPNSQLRVIKVSTGDAEMLNMFDCLITPLQLIKNDKLTAALAEITGTSKATKLSKPELQKEFGAPLMNAAFRNEPQYQRDKHLLRKLIRLLPCATIKMEYLVTVVDCYSESSLNKIKKLVNCTKQTRRTDKNAKGSSRAAAVEAQSSSKTYLLPQASEESREKAPKTSKSKPIVDKPRGHRTPPKAKLRANELAPRKAPLRRPGNGPETGSLFDADN